MNIILFFFSFSQLKVQNNARSYEEISSNVFLKELALFAISSSLIGLLLYYYDVLESHFFKILSWTFFVDFKYSFSSLLITLILKFY